MSEPEDLSSKLRQFMRQDTAPGILLFLATLLALITANSPASGIYESLIGTPVEIRVGNLEIAKPLLLWVNDGLMAVFFFLVGLEIKREILSGELREPARLSLPAFAAVGGMAGPALIYVFWNWGDAAALRGWAIPSATDIAFSLGILGLLGKRVPVSLKIFLMTLAVFDDLGAIVIIALFYTKDLEPGAMLMAAITLGLLALLNIRKVHVLPPYILLGMVLWVSVLKSGVHATLAGVVLAFFIPYRTPVPNATPPLKQLEHDLQPSVLFGILPVFAFMNTGISLQGLSLDSLLAPIPLGIALGLFFGNQIGVFFSSLIAVKMGWGQLPSGIGWRHVYGVAALCGVGFTMSLFISSLAFQSADLSLVSQGSEGIFTGGGGEFEQQAADERLGIMLGSLLSAVVGFLILHFTLPKTPADAGVEKTTAESH